MTKADDRRVALWDLQNEVLRRYGHHPEVADCLIKQRPGRVVVWLSGSGTGALREQILADFDGRVEVTFGGPEGEPGEGH